MRLFVAIFPPEDLLDDLRRQLPGFRLTSVERWHLTLAFLGEVEPERLRDVEAALDGVRSPGPITLRMSGGGSFGTGRSVAVWAGIDGDLAALGDLHGQIRRALPEGDDRPFTPHLTVSYAGGAALRDALSDYAGPTWKAEAFVLVRSRPREGGGYEHLRTWRLG